MDRQSQNELQQYRKMIHFKFSEIYFTNNDQSISHQDHSQISSLKSIPNIKSFHVTEELREQIFYQEYAMEKRGKKFGSSEMRIFKCVRQNQELLQVDKNRNAKRLPSPMGFKIQVKQLVKDANEMQWNSKFHQAKYRIKLMFKERSEVCVYFEKEQNCMQIACFIKSVIYKKQNRNESVFMKCHGVFGNSLAESFIEKIVKYKSEVGKRKDMKRQQKAIKSLQLCYNDGLFMRKFIEDWRNRVFLEVKGQNEKKYAIRKINIVRVDASNRLQSKSLKLRVLTESIANQRQRNNNQANDVNEANMIKQVSLIEGLGTKDNNQSRIGMARTYVEYYVKESQDSQKIKQIGSIRSKQRVKFQILIGEQLSIDNHGSNGTEQGNKSNDKYEGSLSIFQLQYASRSIIHESIIQETNVKCKNNWKVKKIQLNLLPSNHQNSVMSPKPSQAKCKPQYLNQQNALKAEEQFQDHERQKLSHETSFEQKITSINHQTSDKAKPLTKSQLSIVLYIQVNYSEQIDDRNNISENQQKVQKISNQIQKKQCSDKVSLNTPLDFSPQFTHHYIPFLQNISLKQINHPPSSQVQNSQLQIELIPVINQKLSPHPIPKTIEQYAQKYSQYIQSSCPVQISFNCVRRLVYTLKVNSIVNKFLSSPAFASLKDQSYEATLIYQFLVDKSSHLKYYDVQKLILQHNAPQMRRILNAIKTFDQTPRINFTAPSFKIAQRMLFLVKSQANSMNFYQGSFKENKNFNMKQLKGIESCAFFIILGVIKQFSSVLIYQKDVCKRVLHSNTLLLKLVIKKQCIQIYRKCLSLQVNIEALFGIQFCSMLSEYFSDQIWTQVILRQLSEKEKENQVFTLIIAAFIVLLQETMRDREQILTGESLIIYLKQKSRTMNSHNQFFQQVHRVGHLLQFHKQGEYKQIMAQLQEMYGRQNMNEDKMSMGLLANAVYKQFMHYKPKSISHIDKHPQVNNFLNQQHVQRKVFMTIDKLNLPESDNARKVLIQVFQAKTSLYSHEFKNIDLQTFTLSLELTPKTTQNILVYIKTKHQPYYYTLDLNNTPSNYYHHHTQPLQTSLKHNFVQSSNTYISFQLFIKDLTPIQHFQQIVPLKYCHSLMYDSLVADSLPVVNKFLKNFRMNQNNFNLLYAKLGWYANHYLIPHDRLLSVFLTNTTKDQTIIPSAKITQQYDKTYAIAQYTRIIFGKAIIPKPKSLSQTILIDTVKNKIRSISNINPSNQSVNPNKSSPADEHKTTQNLLTYALQNFDTDSLTSFYDFYHQMTQLPLMDYLTYDPMIFHILPHLEFDCTYINQVEGVKLKFTVILSESPDQRKEGQPWEKLLTEFSLSQINLLEKLMVQLEENYFGNDDSNESDGLRLMTSSSSRVNYKGMASLNIKAKQFFSLFPKTLNFSHVDSNCSIDQFGLIMKFNILLAIVKKLYKGCNKKQLSLKQQIALRQEQMKNSQKFHYDIKLYQDDHHLPNTQYYHLFRYMIQAPKQLRVDIHLKKQRNVFSQESFTSGNFLIPGSRISNSCQNDVTHQQLIDKTKNISFNHIKTYNNWALINGQCKSIQVLEKGNLLKSDQLQSLSSVAMTKSNTFKKEAGEDTIIQAEPLIAQDSQVYVVQEMESRKMYKIKSDSIIWRNHKSKQFFQ